MSLIVRNEQMLIFDEIAIKSFEDALVRALFSKWKAQCEILTEAGVRDSIRLGVDRSKSYGFRTENHIAQYVDLMYSLGFEFDTQISMAIRTLNDDSLTPKYKLKVLYGILS